MTIAQVLQQEKQVIEAKYKTSLLYYKLCKCQFVIND